MLKMKGHFYISLQNQEGFNAFFQTTQRLFDASFAKFISKTAGRKGTCRLFPSFVDLIG